MRLKQAIFNNRTKGKGWENGAQHSSHRRFYRPRFPCNHITITKCKKDTHPKGGFTLFRIKSTLSVLKMSLRLIFMCITAPTIFR